MRLHVQLPAAADPSGAPARAAYPIDLVDGLPGPALAAALAETTRARRVLIVSDGHVAPLYAAGVEAALVDAGLAVATLVVPAGEASKSLPTIERALDAAFDAKLSRSDAFVALGGGVVGDLTGFAAAIYQRGVDVVQVPTTLLAQVDSSVGGKTGVNHARGKNLVGAFWQPRAVVASQAVLRTLAAREVRCGLAEAVKHAFLAAPELVPQILAERDALLRLDPAQTAPLVAACCRIKAAVVADDPREDPVAGRRAILNLGHTFGHAYEKLLGYGTWTHGEAVALGMVWSARLSERLGVAAPGLEAEVVRVLAALDLPHAPDGGPGAPGGPGGHGLPTLAALIDAARGDKKGDAESVRFVLLAALGEPLVRRLAWSDIAAALAAPAPSNGRA